MDQNLSGYKIFYEVASCGNISKAAKKFYISQPAISKSIVKLEEGLDTRLFHRNSRGVTLTEEGELLYRHIKNAFDSINSAENELRRMREYNIGHIQIGASSTLCHFVLMPYLKSFMEKYPNIRVSITTQDSANTLTQLETGKLDIGLIAEPKSIRPNIHMIHQTDIHDTFVASPQYLENLRRICGEDCNLFAEANIMLLNQQNMTRRHIDDYFKRLNIEPAQILEVDTMNLLIDFAKVGLGISCVIREFVQDEIENGTLVEIPLATSIPSRSIGFVYNSGNSTKSLEAFLKLL